MCGVFKNIYQQIRIVWPKKIWDFKENQGKYKIYIKIRSLSITWHPVHPYNFGLYWARNILEIVLESLLKFKGTVSFIKPSKKGLVSSKKTVVLKQCFHTRGLYLHLCLLKINANWAKLFKRYSSLSSFLCFRLLHRFLWGQSFNNDFAFLEWDFVI